MPRRLFYRIKFTVQMDGGPVRKAVGKLYPLNILSHEASGILNKEEEKKVQGLLMNFLTMEISLLEGLWCCRGQS